ncbi:hypothetical protein B0H21DRAFT_699480 [Amylocystis lapponica]|nr:hypothetical protein B0H21DRAFT_699480 [Amylocystis lapponica]
MLAEKDKRITVLETDLDAKRHQLSQTHDAYQKQNIALAEAERTATALRNERDDAQALLKTRTEELRAAQVYLTKTDGISEGDVRRMVEGLNAEIFQNAAMIADAYQHHIGPRMLRMFNSAVGPIDPILIQVAVQACMVKYASDTIVTWDLGVDEKRGFLDRVYHHLRDAESQTVAGRWRMLTHQYAALSIKDVPDMAASLTQWLAASIADVLHIARVPGQWHQTVVQEHGSRLKGLVGMMLQLRKAIGEEIIASDFRPTLVLGKHDFDPESMEDGFGGPSQKLAPTSRIRVFCTTGLGLQRWERIQSEGDSGSWLGTIALKPKVLLETVLTELAQEKEVGRKQGTTGTQTADDVR